MPFFKETDETFVCEKCKREFNTMKIAITAMMVRQTKGKNVMPVVEWANIIVLSKTSARIVFTCI